MLGRRARERERRDREGSLQKISNSECLGGHERMKPPIGLRGSGEGRSCTEMAMKPPEQLSFVVFFSAAMLIRYPVANDAKPKTGKQWERELRATGRQMARPICRYT